MFGYEKNVTIDMKMSTSNIAQLLKIFEFYFVMNNQFQVHTKCINIIASYLYHD